MIDLTITSGYFLLCLVIGPLLMAQVPKLRRFSFLIVCLGIYLATISNFESLIALTVFIGCPYVYIYVVRRWDVSLWPAIIFQIVLLIYLNKYTWILAFFNVSIPSYITLIGISYFFFRQFDVLFQVKARLVESISIIDYLNYLFSFWTILAGPIQRYRDFISEFYKKKEPLKNKDTLACFHRAANGMLKILIVASIFLYLSDLCYTNLVSKGASFIYILGIFYCFPLYVYFNFSGYCDVVISMARWAGFAIPENFDRPYVSRDMIEMWQRWHITLSQWVRDYVYQPMFKFFLSGPFRNKLHFSQYLSIFITFFIVGIWHGTSINFVIFGLLQGLGMALSMIYRDLLKKHLGKEKYISFYTNRWIMNAERVITLHFWCFTFLFFQYDLIVITSSLIKITGVSPL